MNTDFNSNENLHGADLLIMVEAFKQSEDVKSFGAMMSYNFQKRGMFASDFKPLILPSHMSMLICSLYMTGFTTMDFDDFADTMIPELCSKANQAELFNYCLEMLNGFNFLESLNLNLN